MLDLYCAATPNGNKITILLEELGLDYRYRPVDLSKGEQTSLEFLARNPNGKIPVLVDPNGPDNSPLTLAESGAIMIYLAEKTGSALLPSSGLNRAKTLQWLMFQMSAVGPTFGQIFFFKLVSQEPNPEAANRFIREANRLIDVMERQLKDNPFIAGANYSIADIALYPWLATCERLRLNLDNAPSVRNWIEGIGERSAVEAGMNVSPVPED